LGALLRSAIAHGGFELILWDGVIKKVLIPIVASPLGGFFIGLLVMSLIYRLFAHAQPGRVNKVFRSLQVASAGLMSYSHCSNDAQKSMVIITMALLSQGLLAPPGAEGPVVPKLVIFLCAIAMAAGTSM